MAGRYYPSEHPHRLNEDLRLLYDHVYQLQDQLAAAQAGKGVVTTGGKETTAKPTPQRDPGGPSTTKIAGLNVIGIPPKHQQVLMYNAESGQIEWGDIGP